MIVPLFIPARWRAAPDAGIEDDDSELAVTELMSTPPAAQAAGPAHFSEPQ